MKIWDHGRAIDGLGSLDGKESGLSGSVVFWKNSICYWKLGLLKDVSRSSGCGWRTHEIYFRSNMNSHLCMIWNVVLVRWKFSNACGKLKFHKKVTFMIKRAFFSRLPTKVNLFRRNVQLHDDGISCALCNGKEEDESHILFSSRFSQQILWRWYNLLGLATVLAALR